MAGTSEDAGTEMASQGTTNGSSGVGGTTESTGTTGPVDESCFVQVSVGGHYTCVVKADGTLWCWGGNTLGQLGIGTTDTPKPEPVQVTALGGDVARVSAGTAHTCAIKRDGTAWCWGWNEYGQLGDGTRLDRPTPRQVTALGADLAQISAGSWQTCAVKQDGTLWCWGRDQLEPEWVVALGTDVAQVSAAGPSHTCAVKKDDTLWCWGGNVHGQLGDGTTDDRLEPIQVTAPALGVAKVSARSSRTCAVTKDGTLWCWGHNLYGQVGDGTDGPSNTPKTLPVQITALGSGVERMSAGTRHGCASKVDGTLWCWGSNQYGAIGDGHIDTTCEVGGDWACEMNRPAPVHVTALGADVVEVRAGDAHTCARKDDDTLWCWGANGNGRLGDGTTEGEPCGSSPNVSVCRPSPVRALIGCP